MPWRTLFPSFAPRVELEMRELWDKVLATEVGRTNGAPYLPPVNVAETDKGYEVAFDLPGIDPKDITVEVRDGMLRVGGERKEEKEEKGKTFYRMEKEYGAFHRVIPFDVPVDPKNVEATYRNGVLRVSLAKTEEARPKKIEVKA
jgi:HSP20 family protein